MVRVILASLDGLAFPDCTATTPRHTTTSKIGMNLTLLDTICTASLMAGMAELGVLLASVANLARFLMHRTASPRVA